jgi:hypothetical protein
MTNFEVDEFREIYAFFEKYINDGKSNRGRKSITRKLQSIILFICIAAGF